MSVRATAMSVTSVPRRRGTAAVAGYDRAFPAAAIVFLASADATTRLLRRHAIRGTRTRDQPGTSFTPTVNPHTKVRQPMTGSTGTYISTITPFTLHIPQAGLDDLRQRLPHTRWPGKETDNPPARPVLGRRIRLARNGNTAEPLRSIHHRRRRLEEPLPAQALGRARCSPTAAHPQLTRVGPSCPRHPGQLRAAVA